MKRNIFLFQNERKNNQVSIKIGDLGVSKETEKYLTDIVGVPFYASPEMKNGETYTAATDVW